MLCEICGIFDGGTCGSGGLRGNTGCSLSVLCRWARGDLHGLGKEEGGRHGNGFWRVHGSSRTTLRDGCCESRNAFRRGDFTEMTGVLPQRRVRMSWTRGTCGECGLGRRCALCCSHRRPDYDDHRKSFRHGSWPPHFFYDKARQVQPMRFVLRVHRVSRERGFSLANTASHDMQAAGGSGWAKGETHKNPSRKFS